MKMILRVTLYREGNVGNVWDTDISCDGFSFDAQKQILILRDGAFMDTWHHVIFVDAKCWGLE